MQSSLLAWLRCEGNQDRKAGLIKNFILMFGKVVLL